MASLRNILGAMCCALAAAQAPAASVSLCASDAPAPDAENVLFGPQGRPVRLTVGERAEQGCASVELPVPAEAVRWHMLTDIPVEAPPPRRLGLQGYFDAAAVRISEVIHAQSDVTGEPGFIPFHADMQPYLRPRPFGIEERASMDGDRLVCDAGAKPAGVVLQAAARWEHLPQTELVLAVSGTGEFALAIADSVREQAETPLQLGSVAVTGGDANARFRLPDDAARWSSLVVSCPLGAAALTFDRLSLVPPARAAAAERATWLWDPELWRAAPERVWALAGRERLRRINVTIPVDATGAVADEDVLAGFIAEARSRGIAVWAVVGDRADVLPQNLAPLLARARAYQRFNREHAAERIAGMQLDIEPYLLPGFTLAPDYWRERYVATVTAVHRQLAQELPLDLVMPVWWGAHPAWGSRLLDALALPALSLTVMNYRTDIDVLRAGAMPFFVWGETRGNAVSMALETGRAGINADDAREETRIDYAAAEAGELWLLELDGRSLLLLLDRAYAGLPGQAYAKTNERMIGIDTISFAAGPQTLDAVAAQLEAEWSAWTAFAGLAIHGLDQPDAQEP